MKLQSLANCCGMNRMKQFILKVLLLLGNNQHGWGDSKSKNRNAMRLHAYIVYIKGINPVYVCDLVI